MLAPTLRQSTWQALHAILPESGGLFVEQYNTREEDTSRHPQRVAWFPDPTPSSSPPSSRRTRLARENSACRRRDAGSVDEARRWPSLQAPRKGAHQLSGDEARVAIRRSCHRAHAWSVTNPRHADPSPRKVMRTFKTSSTRSDPRLITHSWRRPCRPTASSS